MQNVFIQFKDTQSQFNCFISLEINNLIFLKGPIHWMTVSEMARKTKTTKSFKLNISLN